MKRYTLPPVVKSAEQAERELAEFNRRFPPLPVLTVREQQDRINRLFGIGIKKG